jgi:predicted nuclease of predicted toxin-antitoxin system
VRLLLDANLSPKRVGRPLEGRGHDVLSLAADAALGALADAEVLALAAEQRRILVTRNSRDFVPLLREWAEGDRHHQGCILIWTLAHNEFGKIVSGVVRLLDERPGANAWRDLTVALFRPPASR